MDWQPVIIALIVAIPSTLLGIATIIQATRTHGLVNSRMEELLRITRSSSRAEGVLDGRQAEKDK